MNFSAPFVARPVATTLLSLALVVLGLVAFRSLPLAPLPRVEVPTIRVSAQLPGASPETMAAVVAQPLERAFARIAGITQMSSTNVAGTTDIVLLFEPERDMNGAARDVQAALNAARGELPQDMPSNPQYRLVSPADAPILVLGLTSTSLSPATMYEAASIVLERHLARIPGVGDVALKGAALPAVRVELDPQALAQRHVSFAAVRQAIAATNLQHPVGGFEDGGRYWQIATSDRFADAAEFRDLIVADDQGAVVHLGDVAQVVDGVENPENVGGADGKPAVLAIIRRKPGANIVKTVELVEAQLPALREALPQAMELEVLVDRTVTVRSSLRTAEHTLVVAMVLVMLVMLLFLHDVRAALVASAAVPIAVAGTFVVMAVLGYSLDNLSLMALIIAVGFAVDDAVVVVENIARHVEAGVPPRQAAIQGAQEVGLTVVSMSAVLIAVFIPLLFMSGYVGLFVREFAVTIVIVIVMSLLVALTTMPMLCALVLKRSERSSRQSRARRWSRYGLARLLRAYMRSLDTALAHPRVIMLILGGVVLLNVYLYATVPKGFFPRQDTGQLTGRIHVADSGSFPVLRRKLADFSAIVRADPAVLHVAAYAGDDEPGSGSVFVTLKPLASGRPSADKVAARLRTRLAGVAGASIALNSVQDINVGGRRSRSNYQYTVEADDPAVLDQWAPRIVAALERLPQLREVSMDTGGRGLETVVHIDRDVAARSGVTVAQVDTVLRDAFAQAPVATLYKPHGQYRVVMGVAPQYAQAASALDRLHVGQGMMAQVPLASLARTTQRLRGLEVEHAGQFVARTMAFELAPGASLSSATRAIQRAVDDLALPNTVRGAFEGSTRAFRQVQNSQPTLILAAFLTLFIVLGVLYESVAHPLTILSTLPSAGVGALLALWLLRTDFDVIAFIGVFALVGIVMKNAIMMVDFALQAQRSSGALPHAAIRRACLLRFRPIMMTSLAVFLAAIPLVIAYGGGAEMRRPLGIAIGGGLIASQLLTLYTTPVVFLYLDRAGKWLAACWKDRAAHLDPSGVGEAS